MADPILPVPPELFGRLVAVAITAGQERAPRIQAEYQPPADPFVQAAIAVRGELTEQPELFDPVMNRFTALMDLFNRNRLSEWVRTSPRNSKAQDIHPAVVHVAAQLKVKKNGRFPEKRFLQAVQEVAAQYPAWADIDTSPQANIDE